MKMNIKKLFSVLLASILLLLSGCSYSLSMENLLSPPKLTEEQTAIYEALKKSKSGDITLKYPKSGDYRSAFVIHNIDDEPSNEAMVFYTETGVNGETTLRINFLDQNNGKWESVYDLPAIGTDVERVAFEKLGDNDVTNIIVGFSILNQSEKALRVYTYKNKIPSEVFLTTYSVLDILDLDGDQNKEIFLINYDKGISYSTATVNAWKNDVFTTLSKVELDPTASEYLALTQSPTPSGKTALFIDHAKGDGRYGTDILYYQGNRLVNVVYDAVNNNTEKLLRKSNATSPVVHSLDVDGDGFVEAVGTVSFPGYEESPINEQIQAFIWYSVDKGKLTKEYYSFASPTGEFLFIFPGRWEGLVTVTWDADTNTAVFWQTATPIQQIATPLLRIQIAPKHSPIANDWKLIEGDFGGDNEYRIQIPNRFNPLALTLDEIQDAFVYLGKLTK